MTIQRTKTGIAGLDELIEGGFPNGRMILVSGACGTGKTIFAMQFLYKGITEYGENGVFVTFDEMPSKLREDMTRFKWDLDDLEKKGKIAIIDATSARAGKTSKERYSLPPMEADIDKMMIEIITLAKKINAKRIVVDSIPAMALQFKNSAETRRAILKMAYAISQNELTGIITSEISEQGLEKPTQFSKYGVEEYIADGVVLLNFLGVEKEANRTLHVRKMRGTDHASYFNPMFISEKGITVKKIEEVYK